MKKILRNIICLFLINAVLVSTSGAVIHKHFCPISAKTDVSFEKGSHCCGSDTTEEKDGCCEIEQQVLTADFLVSGCSFEFKSDYSLNINLPVYSALMNYNYAAEYLEKLFSYFPPPPKSGKFITIQNQVFQI